MDYEDFIKRKQLCKECMSEACIFNPDGICMFPMVSGRGPQLHDEGCDDYCYKEGGDGYV